MERPQAAHKCERGRASVGRRGPTAKAQLAFFRRSTRFLGCSLRHQPVRNVSAGCRPFRAHSEQKVRRYSVRRTHLRTPTSLSSEKAGLVRYSTCDTMLFPRGKCCCGLELVVEAEEQSVGRERTR